MSAGAVVASSPARRFGRWGGGTKGVWKRGDSFYRYRRGSSSEYSSPPITPYAYGRIELAGVDSRAVKLAPRGKRGSLIRLSRRLGEAQVAAIRLPAHPQQRPVPLLDSTGDEPHDESDSRFVGRVGVRPVNESAVMQVHLARL